MSKYADLIRRLESDEGAGQNLEVDLCGALDFGPKEYWGAQLSVREAGQSLDKAGLAKCFIVSAYRGALKTSSRSGTILPSSR